MTRARDLAAFVSNADGDIKFDTDTLFIDSSTNRIGLGTNAPSVQLDIESTAPTIRLTDSDATGTPESEVSGAGGDITIRADRDNEKASSIIGFEVDGSERMRISADGNIGLGETSPTADIHMTKADDINEIIMDANRPSAGQLIGRHRYYWNGTEVARMEGDAGSDTTNKDDGYLRFLARASGSSIAEKLRIDSDGLKFNGDTAAANAIDDYEEGTFTPTSGVTLGADTVGVYRKIGKLVHVGMKFTMGSSSSGSTAVISNLPFANVNSNAARAGLVVGWNSNGLGAGLTFLVGQGSTSGNFYLDGSARSYSALANKTFYIGGTYPTAS